MAGRGLGGDTFPGFAGVELEVALPCGLGDAERTRAARSEVGDRRARPATRVRSAAAATANAAVRAWATRCASCIHIGRESTGRAVDSSQRRAWGRPLTAAPAQARFVETGTFDALLCSGQCGGAPTIGSEAESRDGVPARLVGSDCPVRRLHVLSGGDRSDEAKMSTVAQPTAPAPTAVHVARAMLPPCRAQGCAIRMHRCARLQRCHSCDGGKRAGRAWADPSIPFNRIDTCGI